MRDHLIGLGAAMLAVTIWAGWIVATRAAGAPEHGAALTPLDIALLRFSAPALLLAPIWLAPLWRPAPAQGRDGLGARIGAALRPKGASWLAVALMFGWGLPFALAAALGAARADATAFGALTPGAMPLWAAGLAWALFGAAPGRDRRLGLWLIAAAAAASLFLSAAPPSLEAALYLSAAALFWAAYAVGFARAGLSPLHAAGLVGGLSLLLGAPLLLLLPSHLAALSGAELLWHSVTQGLLAGVLSVAAFGLALEKLGAAGAAAPALTPPLTSLMGWAWLGEAPDGWGFFAVSLAGVGVFLAAGGPALLRRGRAQSGAPRR
ncbi:MAG: EamA/RhaT family transporter [Pseudomonadota bacterium]